MSLSTLDKIISEGVKLTPMMEQYYGIKKDFADTLVLFRMGDFYEVFFDDAKDTARLLNITLTHRGKLGDFPIPMAGIPHHAAAAYIDRLTGMGLKVAICEQVESPKDAVGIVKRAVTQVVSPGMPYDADKVEEREHRYMVSGALHAGTYYLVAIDFTTGEFGGHTFQNETDFIERLRFYSPKEYITWMGQWERSGASRDFSANLEKLLESFGTVKTHLSQEYFEVAQSEVFLEKLIPGFKRDKFLKNTPDVLGPVGALAYYICSTQVLDELVHIHPFKLTTNQDEMKVTMPTLTGLEIFPKARDSYRESLVGFFDKAKSSMGSRRLKKIFQAPTRSLDELKARQELVGFFTSHESTLEELREILSDIRDIERVLVKVSTAKATASDLINLARAVESYDKILEIAKKSKLPLECWNKLSKKSLPELASLAKRITSTLNDEIGASLEKGNLIKDGADKSRDRLARLTRNAEGELTALEESYRESTGIQKLRVKHNNINGYFIEVSKTHTDKVPKNFERRQTLVNSERYVTDELVAFEKEMLSAKLKLEKLEREIFKGIITEVGSVSSSLRELAISLSLLDAFGALAWVSLQENLVRPEFVEGPRVFDVKGGFHPLIRSLIKDHFVAHDIYLDHKCPFALITGPNMAGKTTVMREVAIIQLLAQIGSNVPATSARLSLCDTIFSRLGASDDILKGQSTFMVEMSETAEIIRHATSESLIILDEVGRGTSTYDGLSIAWALVEYLTSTTRAFTLFATHYHELIEVVDEIKNAKNMTVETMNEGGEVQFLYRLIDGPASQSFGIHVAKLAGLPEGILRRSSELLSELERDHHHVAASERPKLSKSTKKASAPERGTQLCFFEEERPAPVIPEYLKQLEGSLEKIDVLNMTPLEAIAALHELKSQLPMQ